MPLREIEEKFTRSELVLMAWRSQEQHWNFKEKVHHGEGKFPTMPKAGKKRKEYLDGIGPERMPDEFFDEHGDFNLSKVTGEKARQYFEHVLHIPLPPGISRIRDESEVSQQIRNAYGIRR